MTAADRLAASMLAALRDYEAATLQNRPDTPGGAVLLDSGDIDTRLHNAGRIRRLANSIDMPALIIEAWKAGNTVPHIAETLSVGESYVYRIIRKHNTQQ